MQHSPVGASNQEGVDPLAGASPLSTWTPRPGWACLDVKRICQAGGSLAAIGLAAAMVSRDETASSEERLRTVYGLDRFQANKVLRELVVSGFLELRGGLYCVNSSFRQGEG